MILTTKNYHDFNNKNCHDFYNKELLKFLKIYKRKSNENDQMCNEAEI